MSEPLHVWTYWEGRKLPYIETCLKSMFCVCDVPGVEFHLLSPENLNYFIGKNTLYANYQQLRLPMKAAAIRAALLAKYGGWWWDADTIGLQSPLGITSKYPEAEILYMTWSKPPRRILNGYIYAKPKSSIAQEWLSEINRKISTNFDKANTWLELGEKTLTPLIDNHPNHTQEIDRSLFLPIDIDKHVARFFKVIDFNYYLTKDTVCYGLNNSWFLSKRWRPISFRANQWKPSPILIHQLLHHTETKYKQKKYRQKKIESCKRPNRKLFDSSSTTGTAIVTLASGDYWKGAKALFHTLEKQGLPDNVSRIVLSDDPIEPTFAKRVSIDQDYSWIKTKSGQFAPTANKFSAFTLPYSRIILIDCDMLCVRDCQFLWSHWIDNLPFYAVYDTACNHYYPKEIKQIGLNINQIFNAGTMVYNKTVYPDLHMDLMEAIKSGECKSYDGGDQGYLNSFFQISQQEIGYLPIGYNYVPDQLMPKIPEQSRHLIHFTGGVKPWEKGYKKDLGDCNQYSNLWEESFQS